MTTLPRFKDVPLYILYLYYVRTDMSLVLAIEPYCLMNIKSRGCRLLFNSDKVNGPLACIWQNRYPIAGVMSSVSVLPAVVMTQITNNGI